MQWLEGVGWPVEPWDKGVPYDVWLQSATAAMIARYRDRGGSPLEQKAKSGKKSNPCLNPQSALFN